MVSIRFRDATEAAGIHFVHTDGSSGRRYIVETVTCGLGLIDYDGDGYPELYLCQYVNWSFLDITTNPRCNGYSTKIGTDGYGLSQSQQQRILIARAVYKNPPYLFFDEATNALDASTEKIIVKNLEAFFKGKTVIVIAHRLSTVRRAAQIVVLDAGRIVEQGTHQELTTRRGAYYHLVKDQLELGL